MISKKENKLEIAKKYFHSLNKEERQEFLKLCRNYEEDNTRSKVPTHNQKVCPHCHKEHIVKFGKKGNIQRYICKDCGKTFTSTTNTIFFHTRKSTKVWKKYIEMMFEDYCPLERIANKLHLNIKTAFYWRHKILSLLTQAKTEKLSGVIEIDETYFRKSQKGAKHINRPPRHRGEKSKYAKENLMPGLSIEKVCVLCAIDNNKTIYNKPISYGNPHDYSITNSIGKCIEKDSLVVIDGSKALKNGLEYIAKTEVLVGGIKHNNYHLNHINSYHNELKNMIGKIKGGVATKYLQNYVNFFKALKSKYNIFNEITSFNTIFRIKDINNIKVDF